LIHNYKFDLDFYLFHYKTMWCPFNLSTHDKELCVYAHNWQDFRRRPDVYGYSCESCPNWNVEQAMSEYGGDCPDKFDCLKCHGWKELEFHPLIYKLRPCKLKGCQNDYHCPLYHSPEEKRKIEQMVWLCFTQVKNETMKYYPKNRLIINTFKYTKKDIAAKQGSHTHSRGRNSTQRGKKSTGITHSHNEMEWQESNIQNPNMRFGSDNQIANRVGRNSAGHPGHEPVYEAEPEQVVPN
jgi:hypothetical protein